VNQKIEVIADKKSILVVLLHAYTHHAINLKSVEEVIHEEWSSAVTLRPELPASLFSMTDPNLIVSDLLTQIDQEVKKAEDAERPFEEIILIGHSLGALLARKVYVVACGETSSAPFEDIYRKSSLEPVEERSWAKKVKRLILFAGMNRGWRVSHHISLKRAPLWMLGSGICHIIHIFTGRWPLIFTIRRGAEFITQLRIQWLRMQQRAGTPKELNKKNSSAFQGNALTIQLLGSIDDMVAPEDNVDLVSGKEFIYLDVPYSGHADVVDLTDTRKDFVTCKTYGDHRKDKFLLALTSAKEKLEKEGVIPSDENFTEANYDVQNMVFVIHGIRDAGYWTHKIARRIKERARYLAQQKLINSSTEWATETSSYGYFPMLPFIFPWYRRQKVEWLMDQYTEALARYPKANISYVGHSNGTYLLAKALEIYPCCHFENVVLAGSVVNQGYPWQSLMEKHHEEHAEQEQKPHRKQEPRVKAILNFVATRDWVVAFFPKLFQIFQLQDLGSLGHDGFGIKPLGENIYQAEWVVGGHGAAIEEPMWDTIADFVITGKAETNKFPCKGKPTSLLERLVRTLGHFPLVVWLGLVWILWKGWQSINDIMKITITDPLAQANTSGFTLAFYLLLLWILLNRI
jgi:pimeloyl-ACP methyl ester carboxylesterase